MKYAPVLVLTCNRANHFKRCIESLERNDEAKETDLYIALDYPPNYTYLEGYKENEKYICEHHFKFKNVIVLRRETNYGPGKNGREAIVEIAKKHDRYITTEDDNEFSPLFLNYMNQALEKYENNDKIIRVCSYLPPIKTNDFLKDNEVFFYNGFTPYGTGNWLKKKPVSFRNVFFKEIFTTYKHIRKICVEKDYLFELCIKMVREKKEWGDVLISTGMIIKDLCCVFPAKSLVRNHGFDGSGINSPSKTENDWYCTQDILESISGDFIFPAKIEVNKTLIKRIDIERKVSKIKIIKLWIRYFILRLQF